MRRVLPLLHDVCIVRIEVFTTSHAVEDPIDREIIVVVEDQRCSIAVGTGQLVHHDHIVKLQPLGAVDSHNVYPVYGVSSDGDVALLKLLQKGRNVRKSGSETKQFEHIGIVVEVPELPYEPIDRLQRAHTRVKP